jgi:hypothetical protein
VSRSGFLVLGLVLLLVALAFSVRTLPLYLRLAVPDWPVRGTAYAYLGAWCVHVLPTAPVVVALAPSVARALAHLGQACTGGMLLWFMWKLDVLTQHREPWTVRRRLHPGLERRPTRPGLPDTASLAGLNASYTRRMCGSSWAHAATSGSGAARW